MTASAPSPRLHQATRLFWGLVLLALPVTTFRYVPDFMGRTLVQPLAIFPLLVLAPIMLFQFMRVGRITLPANIRLLLAFLLFALLASAVGSLFAPLPLRGADYDDRVLRGWFSLLVGLLFFFAAFWMNRSEKDLTYSLKWIYAGLVLTILWSLVQAIAINTSWIPRNLVNQIQLSFSDRPLLTRRISGFAYEPAWLADQIVIFYLPWLVAAVLRRRPLFGFSWLEPLLFVLSFVVLIFTYSRGGLLTAILCCLLILVFTGRNLLFKAWLWFTTPIRKKHSPFPQIGLRIGLTVLLAAGLILSITFLSQYQYFARIWDLEGDESPTDYLVDISAGPRLAYAIAGYQTYEQVPFTGVGLGASGLYIYQRYPEWSFVLPEVARQLSPDSSLIPNIKNFYVRLLAETGLPGFWLFVIFFISCLAMLWRMFKSRSPFLMFVAAAGLFAWFAIALRNFTQDSFTIPIMWVILGILVGLYPLHPKEFRLRR